jgi:hypothetical protein
MTVEGGAIEQDNERCHSGAPKANPESINAGVGRLGAGRGSGFRAPLRGPGMTALGGLIAAFQDFSRGLCPSMLRARANDGALRNRPFRLSA